MHFFSVDNSFNFRKPCKLLSSLYSPHLSLLLLGCWKGHLSPFSTHKSLQAATGANHNQETMTCLLPFLPPPPLFFLRGCGGGGWRHELWFFWYSGSDEGTVVPPFSLAQSFSNQVSPPPPKFSYNTRLAAKCHTRCFLVQHHVREKHLCTALHTAVFGKIKRYVKITATVGNEGTHKNTPHRDSGQDKTHRRPISTQTESGNIAVAHLKNTHMNVEFVAKYQVCQQSFAPLLRFRRNREYRNRTDNCQHALKFDEREKSFPPTQDGAASCITLVS